MQKSIPMKTLKVIPPVLLLLSLFGCEKLDLKVDVPNCIEGKIREFKKSDLSCNSGAEVLRYDFQGSYVYVFQPGNCGADMPVKIYNSNCDLLCTLGGFEGRTYCNGESFDSSATNEVLVWQN
jgi:hypothetical protein